MTVHKLHDMIITYLEEGERDPTLRAWSHKQIIETILMHRDILDREVKETGHIRKERLDVNYILGR